MINNFQEIIRRAVAIIEDDFTELWLIVVVIEEENPGLDFDNLIEVTKKVVRELATNHQITLVDEKTEKSLELSVDEIVNAVERRLKELGKIPNIGDGIWFTSNKNKRS